MSSQYSIFMILVMHFSTLIIIFSFWQFNIRSVQIYCSERERIEFDVLFCCEEDTGFCLDVIVSIQNELFVQFYDYCDTFTAVLMRSKLFKMLYFVLIFYIYCISWDAFGHIFYLKPRIVTLVFNKGNICVCFLNNAQFCTFLFIIY